MVSLARDAAGRITGVNMAAHELGHVLGLDHTHQRHDRDQYINVDWGVGGGCAALYCNDQQQRWVDAAAHRLAEPFANALSTLARAQTVVATAAPDHPRHAEWSEPLKARVRSEVALLVAAPVWNPAVSTRVTMERETACPTPQLDASSPGRPFSAWAWPFLSPPPPGCSRCGHSLDLYGRHRRGVRA